MTWEYVSIDVTPGLEDEFARAFLASASTLEGAAGLRSAALSRCVEHSSRFMLRVDWESVAAHEEFRTTEAFATWRAAVGGYFASPPQAAHYEPVQADGNDH